MTRLSAFFTLYLNPQSKEVKMEDFERKLACDIIKEMKDKFFVVVYVDVGEDLVHPISFGVEKFFAGRSKFIVDLKGKTN